MFALLAGCSPQPQPDSPPPGGDGAIEQPELTIAQTLAVIDGNDFDAVKVNRYASLLRQLDESYAENEQQIGDMTVLARQLLEKEGIAEPLLDILESLNRATPNVADATPDVAEYARYAVAYVQLRTRGVPAQQAVRSVAAVARSLP